MDRVRELLQRVGLALVLATVAFTVVVNAEPTAAANGADRTESYSYDAASASTTPPANAPRAAFDGYDPADEVSQSHTRVSNPRRAPVPHKGEGLVYRQTDLTGRRKPYVGQSRSDARFQARQQEHTRENPFSRFEYEVLGRENPGTQLDRLEEYFIRELGGPTTMRNPFGRLQNRRHQMRDERYFSTGGGY